MHLIVTVVLVFLAVWCVSGLIFDVIVTIADKLGL